MEVFLKPFVKFWCSLRLTVVCLLAALVLVFVGTLAQVDQGLYDAQKKYFRSYLLIPEAVGGAGWAQIRMGDTDWGLKPWETCLLYTSPSPRDKRQSRMPSSA